MRGSVRHAGTALLIAALLLAAVAASLRFFAASSGAAAGAGSVGLTPAAEPASRNAAHAGASASSQPGPRTGGRTRASAAVGAPPAVTVAGVAALPSAHVHAGYATPADAVDGFYQALLSGSPARACAYVTKPCPAYGSRPITGRVTVLAAVSHGSEALVQVTGTICVGTSCVPLADRVVMPTGPASFSTSWTSLTSGVYGWAASPLPCVLDPASRQWHVTLG